MSLWLKAIKAIYMIDIISFFNICHEENFKNVSYDYFEEVDNEHGRLEIRRYWITIYLEDIRDTDKWQNLKTIGMVESERHIGEKVTHDKRYYINSIDKQAKVFAKAVRGHWGIEKYFTLDT